MIIYDKRKPKTFDGANCIGVTGENLATTQEFLIRGMCDITVDYYIHLRFADGSVNSVIPDSVTVDETGTKLVWKVKKNDIFMHGYFELQLEGRGENDYVFQTQIVTLYADESIPIEDKEYLNPNSETLKLRDETQKILDESKIYQTKIEETQKLIEASDLTKKENISNKIVSSSQITDMKENYPSMQYLDDNYWTAGESYSSDEVDIFLDEKADKNAINERVMRVEINVNSKYDSSNIESGSSTLTPYSSQTDKSKSATCIYKKVDDTVFAIVSIMMNAGTLGANSTLHFIDLPFRHNSEVPVYFTGINNKGTSFKGVVPKGSTWFQIMSTTAQTYTFADNEQLNFTLMYKI